MQTHLPVTVPYVLFFFLVFSCSAAARKQDEPQDLVRSSCIHARYPRLCLRTLSNYAGPAINTPLDLAQAALKVSLAHARRVSQYFNTLQQHPSSSSSSSGSSLSKRQRVAVSDCVDQMSDSVEELRKSLEELQHLRAGTFQWQMSNAETWVSAALTDGDTCLDGLNDVDDDDDDDGADGKKNRLKWDMKRRITDVARVTSNALYMINRLHGTGKPHSNSNN